MSAIEAASVGVRTMADGTLRLSVDIEPRHAQAAFKLFGAPGTPVALAALKTKAQQEDKPKGGALSQWVAMRCAEGDFRLWLSETYATEWRDTPTHAGPLSGRWPNSAEHAANVVRKLCGVTSRAEIDNDAEARERFERVIRAPWMGRNARLSGAGTASA